MFLLIGQGHVGWITLHVVIPNLELAKAYCRVEIFDLLF